MRRIHCAASLQAYVII